MMPYEAAASFCDIDDYDVDDKSSQEISEK